MRPNELNETLHVLWVIPPSSFRASCSVQDSPKKAMIRVAWLTLARNGGRELLIDAIVYLFAKGIPGAIGLLSVVVFLRATSESEYGRFALVSSIASVWLTFSSGWLYQSIIRFGASKDKHFRRAILTGLCLSILLFVLPCGLHLLIEGFPPLLIGSGVVFGVASILQATGLAKLQAQMRARIVLLAELLRSLSCFAGALTLAFLFFNRAAGLLLGTAAGFTLSFVFIWRLKDPVELEGRPSGLASNDSWLSKWWNFGWPLSVWLAAQLLIPLLDRSMIAARLGISETGKYTALSEVITRSFSLTLFPLVQAVYPRLAKLSDAGALQEARALLRRATLLVIAGGIVLLPLIFGIRQFIVRTTLPASDWSYFALVLPLAAGGFVWQAAMLVHKPLELARNTKAMMIAMTCAVGIKAAANWAFLSPMGMFGAALATVASGVSYCTVCIIIKPRI